MFNTKVVFVNENDTIRIMLPEVFNLKAVKEIEDFVKENINKNYEYILDFKYVNDLQIWSEVEQSFNNIVTLLKGRLGIEHIQDIVFISLATDYANTNFYLSIEFLLENYGSTLSKLFSEERQNIGFNPYQE